MTYQETPEQYTATIEQGYLVPDSNAIRELVRILRENIASDSTLAERFSENPRLVLGERGISLDLQNEILLEGGIIAGIEEAGCTVTCIATSSVCCETL